MRETGAEHAPVLGCKAAPNYSLVFFGRPRHSFSQIVESSEE